MAQGLDLDPRSGLVPRAGTADSFRSAFGLPLGVMPSHAPARGLARHKAKENSYLNGKIRVNKGYKTVRKIWRQIMRGTDRPFWPIIGAP